MSRVSIGNDVVRSERQGRLLWTPFEEGVVGVESRVLRVVGR